MYHKIAVPKKPYFEKLAKPPHKKLYNNGEKRTSPNILVDLQDFRNS